MIEAEIMDKIIRKKIIWAEIKAKEKEYNRLQKQINELKEAQSDIIFEVQKMLQECQEIDEYLDGLEYEWIKK